MKAMMASPTMRRVQHLFLFKNEIELKDNFEDGWHNPDGTIVPFLQSQSE